MNLSEVRVDQAALRFNLQSLKALAPTAKVSAVVKGNAYGHGMPEVVQVFDESVDCFQVDDLQELRIVRSLTRKPVMVLGYVPEWDLAEAIGLDCELGIFALDHLRTVGKAAKTARRRVRIHLKLDALLGRLGILPDELPTALNELELCPKLELSGIYAHYANIEDTTDLTHAEAQHDILSEAEASAGKRDKKLISHISATSGVMTLEGSHPRSLIRLGIGVYGMYPSAPLARVQEQLRLKPALSWVSHLAQVKILPAKHPVGYGLSYVTSKSTKIGIVPQGYSDGYDRGLSNSGEVLVRGRRCPVLGRIAMNMFAVDLSATPDAQAEDEVVLIGEQGSERILAEELAARLGTINYEITSRISPLLPRVLS